MALQQHSLQQQTDSSKVWFITGASRGLGRVWTEDVLARGDWVAATVREETSLKELRSSYDSTRLLVLQLDVTDRARVFEAVQQAHAHFGRLDVVLSNAGYGLEGPIEEVRTEDVQAIFATNVFGTLSLVQAAVPLMRTQGHGHILPVTSIAGHRTLPLMGIYASTKHAVEAIGEGLAQEVEQFGIRVTLVTPGPFKTEFFSQQSYRRTEYTRAEYEALRIKSMQQIESQFGDARATSSALFKVVDLPVTEKPPLRLVLGSIGPEVIRRTYSARLESIAQWEAVSVAAQGTSSS